MPWFRPTLLATNTCMNYVHIDVIIVRVYIIIFKTLIWTQEKKNNSDLWFLLNKWPLHANGNLGYIHVYSRDNLALLIFCIRERVCERRQSEWPRETGTGSVCVGRERGRREGGGGLTYREWRGKGGADTMPRVQIRT